jgi:hypothetical protein
MLPTLAKFRKQGDPENADIVVKVTPMLTPGKIAIAMERGAHSTIALDTPWTPHSCVPRSSIAINQVRLPVLHVERPSCPAQLHRPSTDPLITPD